MPATAATNSKTFKVSTPSDTQIRLTRLFDAPKEIVWEAMSKPEHIKRWWGQLGEGYSVPVCEVDLRPGGRWRFVNKHPNGEVAFSGVYKEISPPDRMVFTEENGKTRLTATVEYFTKELRDMVLNSGMDRGAAISYDRLEEVAMELLQSRR